MQTSQIVLGLFIISLTFLDFFHTTLSGNGFGFLAGWSNRLLNRIIILNKDRKIFLFSGMIHLLMTAFIWLLLLFTGTFLIFTSGEDMVVNGTSLLPANYYERFYFTGYLLSTLGIGDFIPGNSTSRIIAGILSFAGFILITIGLTYLLSVVQAVLKKKELAFYLSTLGKDIEEMFYLFKKEENLHTLMSDATNLRQKIFENASSYLSFPVVDYFLTKDRSSALVVQLAVLYEVLMILKQDWPKDSIQHLKLHSIIEAIERYLNLALEQPESGHHNEEKLRTLRSFWRSKGYVYQRNKEIDQRFTSSLGFAGWNWESVYQLKDFEHSNLQEGGRN